jgi:hypothetical protein
MERTIQTDIMEKSFTLSVERNPVSNFIDNLNSLFIPLFHNGNLDLPLRRLDRVGILGHVSSKHNPLKGSSYLENHVQFLTARRKGKPIP